MEILRGYTDTELRAELARRGYYTENLWTAEDVKYHCSIEEALIDVQSLILDKDNHKDGCFKEFPLVLSIIKMALNSKKN